MDDLAKRIIERMRRGSGSFVSNQFVSSARQLRTPDDMRAYLISKGWAMVALTKAKTDELWTRSGCIPIPLRLAVRRQLKSDHEDLL